MRASSACCARRACSTVLVVHTNHANELDTAVAGALAALRPRRRRC